MHNFPLSLYKTNMAKEVVFGLKELLAYEGNVEEDMALTFQVLSNYFTEILYFKNKGGLFHFLCEWF